MAGFSFSLIQMLKCIFAACGNEMNIWIQNSDRFLLLQPFSHIHIHVTIIKTENYEQNPISRAKSTWPVARKARKTVAYKLITDYTLAALALRKIFIFISEILWYCTISFYCFIHNSYSCINWRKTKLSYEPFHTFVLIFF